MDSQSLQTTFPNYLQVRKRISDKIWITMRIFSMIAFAFLCALLFINPTEGLWYFWCVFVPLAPLVFFLSPGLWRNICPLVSANQIPRELKWSVNFTAPKWLIKYGNIIQYISLYAIIPARKFLFEYNGQALAAIMIGFIVFAFIGGLLLKGKSGWCSTLCPLLPIQKIYGQTPFIKIRNYHCRPCVGCVENCYDFNPAVSLVSELNSPKRYVAKYTEFFIASLPGLIYGYFTVPAFPTLSITEIYLGFFKAILVSCFIFFFVKTFIKISKVKISALYGAVTFNLFYWYSIPIIMERYSQKLKISIKHEVLFIFNALVFILTFIWLIKTYRKETKALEYLKVIQGLNVIDFEKKQNSSNLKNNKITVVVKPKNQELVANNGQTLLNLLEENKIPISSGCRMGLCGADPVRIIEGYEALDGPQEEEKNTLRRLGLSENCRLACSVKLTSNLVVSLESNSLSKIQRTTTKEFSWVNKAIQKIVIIGNGPAGMTAAECIRHYHPDCEITIISRESYDYYNRIAIPRLICEPISINDLVLSRSSWKNNPHASCWINTLTRAINTKNKEVILGTHEKLTYDKLILAMGSSTYIPPIKNYDVNGVFKMHDAEDAIHVRSYIQQYNCKHPIILGGGLVGLETAYALYKLSLRPIIIQREDRLLSKQLDERAAYYVSDYLANLGMKIFCEMEISEVLGKKRVKEVLLKEGTKLPCDILIICSGILPNVALAKEAGLSISRGVLVDKYLKTNDPDVYAIGDLVEVNGKPEELWLSAIKQAECASINILGGKCIYTETKSSTVLKVAGIDIASMGVMEPRSSLDRIILHDYPDNRRYKKLIISAEKIVGAILVGYPEETAAINRAINSEQLMTAHLEAIESNQYKWSD